MKPHVRAVGVALRPAVRGARRLATSPALTVIGWHRVDDSGLELSTPVDAFRRHLDAVQQWGANVLPLPEAVRRLRDGTLPEKPVALTFDDGYASVVECAWPILRERGLPATLFVVTGYLGGARRFPWDAEPQTPAAAEALRVSGAAEIVAAHRQGLDIGSHTETHPWLPELGDDDLHRELAGSRATLERLLEHPVRSVAYPTGGWSPRVRDAAEAAGYDTGITVDRGCNTGATHPLALRRAFVPHDPRDLPLLLDGAFTWLRPLDRLRSRGGPEW